MCIAPLFRTAFSRFLGWFFQNTENFFELKKKKKKEPCLLNIHHHRLHTFSWQFFSSRSFYDLILKNCWNNRMSWIVGCSCFFLSVTFFIGREWLLHCNVDHMQSIYIYIYISRPGQFKDISPFFFTAHLSALKPLEEMFDKSPICTAIYKCLSRVMHAFLYRRHSWKSIVFIFEICGWIIIIIIVCLDGF